MIVIFAPQKIVAFRSAKVRLFRRSQSENQPKALS